MPLLLVTGCSAAWLAHLVWDQRVAGSNPVTPTKENSREGPLLMGPRGFFIFIRVCVRSRKFVKVRFFGAKMATVLATARSDEINADYKGDTKL